MLETPPGRLSNLSERSNMSETTCSIAGCNRPSRARTWCNTHYKRWHKTGTTDDPPPHVPRVPAPCSISGCEKPSLSRTWCITHYNRWYGTGSFEPGVRGTKKSGPDPIPLEERFAEKLAQVSESITGCWVWPFARTVDGYGTIVSGGRHGRHLMAHRVSWEFHRGPIPDGLHIDHLCRNPPCVNPDHLEPVTRSINAQRGLMGDLGAATRAARREAKAQGVPYVDPYLFPGSN